MKKVLGLILICLTLCGCSNNSEDKFSYTKINNEERQTLMENNDYVIIDVRTNEEYNIEHIKGAINIPYDEIDNSTLPATDTLFVYCMSGGRSKIAAETLIELGYKTYDLGGIDNIDLEKE